MALRPKEASFIAEVKNQVRELQHPPPHRKLLVPTVHHCPELVVGFGDVEAVENTQRGSGCFVVCVCINLLGSSCFYS